MVDENILDVWTMSATEGRDIHVIPDGCQDVIIVRHETGQTQVLVSPLYHQTIKVEVAPGTEWTGFRLRPGCDVQDIDMPSLSVVKHSREALIDRIESSTRVEQNTVEAIDCIKQHGISVQHCAKQLGVSPRTLQRLLSRTTRQSPSFWLRLARVRRAARTLIESGSCPDVAYQCHYADQAHMCREVRQWFGMPPSELLQRRDLTDQLFWQAY